MAKDRVKCEILRRFAPQDDKPEIPRVAQDDKPEIPRDAQDDKSEILRVAQDDKKHGWSG